MEQYKENVMPRMLMKMANQQFCFLMQTKLKISKKRGPKHPF